MRSQARIALATLCVAIAFPASIAEAKAPPKGNYDCTIGGGFLFGTITIQSGGKYKHRGTKGKFSARGGLKTYPDGRKGYAISFKGGSLNKYKGRWYKASDGTPQGTYEIALKNPLNGFESIYCDRRK